MEKTIATVRGSDHTNRVKPENERDVITRDTPMSQIIRHLTLRGITDLTEKTDLDSVSNYPVATGGFSDIFGARRFNGAPVAIKLPRIASRDPRDGGLQIASRGVYNWSKCRHPNIHELLGFVVFHDRIGMVSTWESNGNVRNYLQCEDISDADRLRLCVEISEGVSYLHQAGIVHGDIKGNNVLISCDGTAMLTDFDDAELGERSLMFTMTGKLAFSLRWVAPELVLGEQSQKTRESDVYSLGMTILAMMTSKLPWAHIRGEAMIYGALLKREIPPRTSEILRDDLWNLLTDCWQSEPQARPGSAYVSVTMKTIWTDSLRQHPTELSPSLSMEEEEEEYYSGSEIALSVSSKTDSLMGGGLSPESLLSALGSIADESGSLPSAPISPAASFDECSSKMGSSESLELSEPEIPSQVGTVAISRYMPLYDVVSHLTARGCRDLSENLDELTFGVLPSRYGGSGDVYCGNLLDSTVVCVKVPRISEDTFQSAGNQVYASREIHTWNKCNHPNILPLLGLAHFRGRIATLSPWIRNGTLREFLKKNPDADRCRLSTQICDGVAYLHGIDIIHGDLKGDNVLISDDGNALLTDFGSADVKNRTITFTQLMDQTGWTTRWGAPELLQEVFLPCKESDVYALGMTILEAITGQLPFADKQEMAVMLAVCFKQETPTRPTAQIPANSRHGDKLWKLLCRCWSRLEERPSAAEVRGIMGTVTKEGLVPSKVHRWMSFLK
ncbi:hypothetical protein RSAG8_04038, partial [Rhizoctonia solani AG-8 WAC10335]